MKQELRHQKIVEWVSERGFVTIEDLSKHFKVTPQTIRRDINQLDAAHKLQRYHGGAGTSSSTLNTPYSNRKVSSLQEKKNIAAAIADLIPNNSSMFINIGTTTEAIATALLDHSGLTVITNNLHVASILSGKSDFKIIIAGGVVRNRDGGIIGEATVDFVSQFKVDFAIIGISGIDLDGELLDFDYQEVRVAQTIVEHSRQIFLAADHSKIGRNAMIRLGNISAADHFFTSRQPPAQLLRHLKEHQVALTVAE